MQALNNKAVFTTYVKLISKGFIVEHTKLYTNKNNKAIHTLSTNIIRSLKHATISVDHFKVIHTF